MNSLQSAFRINADSVMSVSRNKAVSGYENPTMKLFANDQSKGQVKSSMLVAIKVTQFWQVLQQMMQDEDSEEPLSDRDAFVLLQRIDNSAGFKSLQMSQGKNRSLVKKAKAKFPHLYSHAMEESTQESSRGHLEEAGLLIDGVS